MANFLAAYEKILVEKLKNSDKSAFTVIFKTYYPDLVQFSHTFTRDLPVSEEIVQDVFLKLWENRKVFDIHTSLKSHLLKSVQNRSIDWLRHLKIKDNYTTNILSHPVLSENDTEHYVLYSELETHFNTALNNLNSSLSEVYRMSRLENMTYPQIADKLNISVRTVEDRISKALHLLREELKDFLLILILFIHFLHQK